MKKNTREPSYKSLIEVFENKGFSNLVLEKTTKGLNDRDINFTRELTYGVIENSIYYDWIISKFSKIKRSRISNKVLIIIKIGIYQMMNMDKVPDSAAVNETVNLAKKYCNKGSIGFINGMLRNVSKRNYNFEKELSQLDKKDYICIKYSYANWIVENWIESYGIEFTEKLIESNSKKNELNIRVNRLKIEEDKLKERLIENGFLVENGNYNNIILKIKNPQKITETLEYKNGLFSIQDESSSLVGKIMDPKEGSTLIDLCSAPGGKSLYFAEIMNNKGIIISRDIYKHKLDIINRNAKRLGISCIRTEVFNGLDLDDDLIDTADYCLVDAPCSGLGLIRKKPEIKLFKDKNKIDSLPDIQLEILKNASKYLKKDGILVYSTCTINEKENINVIQRFLNKNKNFKLLPFDIGIKNKTTKEGYIQLFTNEHNVDGFFIAKMVKLEEK